MKKSFMVDLPVRGVCVLIVEAEDETQAKTLAEEEYAKSHPWDLEFQVERCFLEETWVEEIE